jgi:hypothetical protein
MSFGLSAAAVGLIGAGVGAGVGIYTSNKAAGAQADSAASANALAKDTSDAQIALQREMFNKTNELNQPAVDAGNTARNRLMQLLGLSAGGADNGSAVKDFSADDFTSDPGYQFRVDQGQQALERSAAARGGLMSGAALKDTARFSQGLASQDYQAAFDRFQVNRSNKLTPLQSLTGTGQTAAATLGSAGQNFANSAGTALGNYGTTAGQNITGSGNARASGYVGASNALTNGLSQAYTGYQQNQLLGMLGKNTSGSGGVNNTLF